MADTPFPYPKETRETDILIGTGVAEYGPFGFKIFDTADVVVLTKPAGQALFSKVSADVTKVSDASFDDFTIDFGENIPPETQFIVRSERVHEREIGVTKGGAISTVELEKELSKQGTVVEELRRDINQGVRADYGGAGIRLAPLPEGHFWKSDADGNMVDGGNADDINQAQSYAAAAGAAAVAAAEASNAAENWAIRPEDDPVPISSGGDGATTYSALHWAYKAAASAATSAGVKPYDTRAEIKALDTTKDKVSYLKGSGLSGIIEWRTGDYSAEIAADPAEGVFAKADGVPATSGALVRSGRIGLPVEWFGAKGDDTTDDTAAINAAFAFAGAMGGGEVLFKAKTYKITGPINVASSNVTWRGESRYGTLIKQYSLSEKIFNVTGAIGCGGQKFATIYAGTPVSGATALYVDSSYFGATEFMVRNGWKGIEVTNRSGPMFTNFEVFDYESVGLHAHSINDVYVNSFIMNAGNSTRGVVGGVRLTDKVEAFICCNGDILLGQYSLTTDAASYTANNRPAYNNFSNVYFDSGARGCLVTKLVETEFVGCWFSGGRTNTTPGLTLTGQTDSLTFVSCRFFNNGSHGFYASNQAARVKLIGCKFQSNSMTAGSGTSHGAYFDGTVGFVVTACSAGNDLYSGQQGYGIYVGAGCSGFSIRDGDMTGNVTGAISDNSGAVEKYISGVRGYKTQNKGTGSIAVGQTVAVISHGLAVTPTAADISISFASSPPASGVSSIYINNITSTTFQVVSNAAVSSTPLTFSWQGRISGA